MPKRAAACVRGLLPAWAALAPLLLVTLTTPVPAQELEPRALTNVPVGTNFALFGYAFATGNILLDPAVPIDDLDSNVHTWVGAYVWALSVFGHSAKLDVIVPFATGDWSGVLADVDTATSRTSFGDPSVRLSVNLLGAATETPHGGGWPHP